MDKDRIAGAARLIHDNELGAAGKAECAAHGGSHGSGT